MTQVLFAAGFDRGHSDQIFRQIVGIKYGDLEFDQTVKWAAKIRCGFAAVNQDADSCHLATMIVHDIDGFLNPAAASDHVFNHDKPFARGNSEATAQDETPFVFFCENVTFVQYAADFVADDDSAHGR